MTDRAPLWILDLMDRLLKGGAELWLDGQDRLAARKIPPSLAGRFRQNRSAILLELIAQRNEAKAKARRRESPPTERWVRTAQNERMTAGEFLERYQPRGRPS